MSRALSEKVQKVFAGFQALFQIGLQQESYRDLGGPRGEVFFDIRDAATGETLEQRHIKNVITQDMSILLARLSSGIDGTNGIVGLAVGTGDPAWDLQGPPAPGPEQRALEAEIFRKPFATVRFVDDNGDDTGGVPTRHVEFVTTFDAAEAAGPLVEMGLVGGDAQMTGPNPIGPGEPDVRGKDTLCNYLTFAVVNKPSSATMTITWRITF